MVHEPPIQVIEPPVGKLINKINDDLAIAEIEAFDGGVRLTLAVKHTYKDFIGNTVSSWSETYFDGPILDYFLEKYGINPVE